MDLRLDDAALRTALQGAVLSLLEPDQRERIISAAVSHLLAPGPRDNYNRGGASPLEEAISHALQGAARTIVVDHMKTDETLRTRIIALYHRAVEKTFTEREEFIVDQMAEAFGRCFKMESR